MMIYIYVMLFFAFSDRELVVIWILILFDLPYPEVKTNLNWGQYAGESQRYSGHVQQILQSVFVNRWDSKWIKK